MAAGDPVLQVSIVDRELVRVAAVRSIVAAEDVPDLMSDALAMVADALQRVGLAPAGPPFARYFSTGADGLDMQAGLPVREPFLGFAVVHPDELPAGPAAVTTHVGSYGGLSAAWAALRARIDQLGRTRADHPWEIYFVGPGSGADESEWRTELVWPLAPEGAAEPGGAPEGAHS